MGKVIIGVDPHKLSATIEVVDGHEKLLGSGRFSTDQAGYTAMRTYVKAWPERVWAIEGSNGAGRPLAQRLLEAGEDIVDVPAKLAARVRLFDTGHNRKTDARDAHSIAIVAVRTKTLRVLRPDGELEALRMLCDRQGGAHPAAGPDREQAATAAGRTHPRPGQEGPHRVAGQGNPCHRAPARHRREDPPQDRRGGARRPDRGRGEDEEGHRRTQVHGQGPRLPD